MKWYQKVMFFLCIVIFSPIIIIGIGVATIVFLFEMPKNKKEYTNSEYFKDFNRPYKSYILNSPEYRFYNSFKKWKLNINYIRQETNELEYFIYDNSLYLFPDFDSIDFNEKIGAWEVSYDGDWKLFEEVYKDLVSKIENLTNNYQIEIIVERRMFPIVDLNKVHIPNSIFLIWSFETAFENDHSSLILRVPTNTKELYEMMTQTPNLCGNYYISDNGNIVWILNEDIQINIDVNESDCFIGINMKPYGVIEREITHWHPAVFDIYNDVYEIGKSGNIIVIHTFLVGTSLLYMGNKENCPYKNNKKYWFGKMYFIEIK